MIGLITLANASAAVRMVVSIINVSPFTNNAKVLLASGGAIWLTNVIAFALWYWDLDRGGPVARARDSTVSPAFVFPEMMHEQHVGAAGIPCSSTIFTSHSPRPLPLVSPMFRPSNPGRSS